MAHTVSDEDGMPALRLEFFKNLCKHQASQISDLAAQVTTQQRHIAELEAYISRLQDKMPALESPQRLSEEHSPNMVSPELVGHTRTKPKRDRSTATRSDAGGEMNAFVATGGQSTSPKFDSSQEHSNRSATSVTTEVKERSEASEPSMVWAAGHTAGVTVHEEAVDTVARDSVDAYLVSPGLEPLDELETDLDLQCQQQPLGQAADISRNVTDREVGVRKRKAEEDLLLSLGEFASDLGEFGAHAVPKRHLSVIRSMKTRPSSSKPSQVLQLH